MLSLWIGFPNGSNIYRNGPNCTNKPQLQRGRQFTLLGGRGTQEPRLPFENHFTRRAWELCAPSGRPQRHQEASGQPIKPHTLCTLAGWFLLPRRSDEGTSSSLESLHPLRGTCLSPGPACTRSAAEQPRYRTGHCAQAPAPVADSDSQGDVHMVTELCPLCPLAG